MIKKGEMTKSIILKKARELFSEQGYAAVTMKDFCEECGLSRGGLYRHFSSTKEIFTALLDTDMEHTIEEIEKDISSQRPAREILRAYLKLYKIQVETGKGMLELAIYEFCKKEKDQKHYIQNRFDTSVGIFEKLIRYGQQHQVFLECDANATAKRIVFLLEGISIASTVITFQNDMLDTQLQGVYEMVTTGMNCIDN